MKEIPVEDELVILIADDDDDDYLLTKKALKESNFNSKLVRVSDGEKLLDYLLQRGEYTENTLRPSLILLDLNMPRMDGRESLKEIKQHAKLRHIPVVVFTTSNSHEDIQYCYNLGSNSFITKPATFESLITAMQTLSAYWFDIVKLPRVS